MCVAINLSTLCYTVKSRRVLTYGSIAGGILSGKYRTEEDCPKDGRTQTYPFYHGEAFKKAMKLVDVLEMIANDHQKPISHTVSISSS